MKMKVVTILLITLMTSLCLAAPRKALVSNEMYQQTAVQKEAGHPDGKTDNHHTMPREYFNHGGTGSAGDDGGSTGNGGG